MRMHAPWNAENPTADVEEFVNTYTTGEGLYFVRRKKRFGEKIKT